MCRARAGCPRGAGGKLFARFASGTTNVQYTLTDRENSVREVIDNTGAKKDEIVYNGWGGISSETGSADRGRYAYTGRETDTDERDQPAIPPASPGSHRTDSGTKQQRAADSQRKAGNDQPEGGAGEIPVRATAERGAVARRAA